MRPDLRTKRVEQAVVGPKPVDQSSEAAVAFATATAIIAISAVAEITVATVAEFAVAAITILAITATLATIAIFPVATRATAPATTATAAAIISAATAAAATVSAAAGRTSAPTTAATRSGPALFRFTHPEVTAAEIGAVQLCHRRFAEFPAREGDKGETTRPPGFPVDRHVQINYGLVLSEKFPQFGFRSVVRQISNIQFHRFLTSCRPFEIQAAVPPSGKNA